MRGQRLNKVQQNNIRGTQDETLYKKSEHVFYYSSYLTESIQEAKRQWRFYILSKLRGYSTLNQLRRVAIVLGNRASLHPLSTKASADEDPLTLQLQPRKRSPQPPTSRLRPPTPHKDPHASSWFNQDCLAGSLRFFVPFTRVSTAVATPLPSTGPPFSSTFGPETLSIPCLARASNLCSSANSFSSLSLRSSSTISRNTKRYAIRKM